MLKNLNLKFIKIGVGAFTTFVIFLILFVTSVFQIESGTKGLVFTNGSLNKVANEGLHFKVPFIQTIKKVDVTTQSVESPRLKSSSKDLQDVSSSINVNYRFDVNNLIEIYEQTRFDVDERIIKPRIQEVLKSVSAKYTAEELIQKRPQVKQEIDVILKEELAKYHVIVEDVQLTNFNFSETFNQAIEAKQTEVQNALKAKNILERTKIESEQRIVQANAEAEAIRIQAEAIRSQGGSEYVQLKWIEKWSGNTPLYISDSSNLISIPNTINGSK